MVGDGVRGPLEEAEAAEESARAVRKPRFVHLRAEVVLVEHEPLSREFEGEGERPESVRRVARLDDVEPLGAVSTEHEAGRPQPAIRELVQVGRKASCVRRGRIPPNQDSV